MASTPQEKNTEHAEGSSRISSREPDLQMSHSHNLRALRDIVDGIMMWQLWSRLAWAEIKRRYRRTIIGPMWTTLSMALSVIAIGTVFSFLWQADLKSFLPYLASGVITWMFMATVVQEGGTLYSSMEPILKQSPMPLSLFAIMNAYRNLLVFFHNFVVFLVIALLFDVSLTINTLLLIPGLILMTLNAAWISLVIGIYCTRFRDLQPVLGSILQITMLITPILWTPDRIGAYRPYIVDPNPAYHFVNIVRSPMMGEAPEMLSWYYIIALTIVGWSFAIFVFMRYRRWILYWL